MLIPSTASWPRLTPVDDPFDRAAAVRRAAALGIEESAFHGLLDRILRGDADAAVALRVNRPKSHDDALPTVTDQLATPAMCAQLATDMTPHLGSDGVERALGDLWLDLDARQPRDRRAVLAALAASAFWIEYEDMHRRSPFHQWCRRKPIADVPERERFRAIDREPHRLCRIDHRAPGAWTVTDLLDDGEYVVDPSPLAHLLCDDGPALLARLAHTTDGRVATVGWVLPRIPDIERLTHWRQIRVWLHRLEDRRATVETIMRDWPWVREVLRQTAELG